ncbi:MAG TPA: type VII secretion protein EccE [Mycobacterium sp.]|nr:type VII secretion protein EccE [Mycobacterium sp.]
MTVRIAEVAAVLALILVGWAVGGAETAGYIGAAVGLMLGLVLAVIPWRGQPLWSWVLLYLHRKRTFLWAEPVTVANDRTGGGIRYQDGVACVAIQVLGTPHTPTVFTGSATTYTENTLEVSDLQALLDQCLGLQLDTLTVVTTGARRRSTGDYPRVYDTMIGPPPYAGQRETWIIARISLYDNADSLRYRLTAGTAAVAAAQRISAALRRRGVRARVGTSTDIVELERRLGSAALKPGGQQWKGVRADAAWLTTYWYRNRDINPHTLAQAWSMQVDGVTQGVTLFRDGTVSATVTVRTAQPLRTPPSVILGTLHGEQSAALAANMCAPVPLLRGIQRGPLPESLTIPVGPSGVLLGKVGEGDRLMLPLSDPAELSRVHIAADDNLVKRLVIRAAGAGDRVTVHTRDPYRWASVRMPDVTVTDRPRPAPGTTISVVDGSMSPAPRPNTVVSVGPPGQPHRGPADVVITQIGPALLEVNVGNRSATVEMELFRAENRYVSSEPISMMSGSEFSDERR